MDTGGAISQMVRASSASFTSQFLWSVVEAAVGSPWSSQPTTSGSSTAADKAPRGQEAGSVSRQQSSVSSAQGDAAPESALPPHLMSGSQTRLRQTRQHQHQQQRQRRSPILHTLSELLRILTAFILRLPIPTLIQLLLLKTLHTLLGWA